MRHHISEELEMAGIVGHVRMRGVRLADIAQGRVGPVPELLEHGTMHFLQCLPLKNFFYVLPRNGLSIINPLLKKQ